MVLPLLVAGAAETSPLWVPAAVGAVGVAGGALGALALGGLTKKEASITNNTTRTSQDVYHSPYETYAPTIQYAPQSSYAYQGATTIINSPNSNATAKLAQSAASSPNQTATYDIPQTYTPTNKTDNAQSSGLFAGTDMTTLAIIAAVAVVGYAFFKK